MQPAHLFHLLHLAKKVLQGELVARTPLDQLFGLVAVKGLLRLFDERHHVAHAQNAAGHAVGVEGLDVGELLARAGELDGLAHHGPDGQGRAAAGVAVELCEDYAVDAKLRIEGFGHVDRVLAGHGVHHE